MTSLAEVDTQLTDQDKAILQKYARHIPEGGNYVEIGTWHGGSAMHAMLVAKNSVDIYTIDYFDQFKFKDSRIKFINKLSEEAVKDWTLPVHLLFIDAGHDLAKQDFAMWEKFLVPGAFVLFHDYAHHSPKVVSDCEEILVEYPNYELVYRPELSKGETSIFQIKKVS